MKGKKKNSAASFWTTDTARYHLGHAAHTELLAQPNYRRIEHFENRRPVPGLEEPIRPVSRAAMKTKPTYRTKKLAGVKHFTTSQRDRQRYIKLQLKELKGKVSPRVAEQLAILEEASKKTIYFDKSKSEKGRTKIGTNPMYNSPQWKRFKWPKPAGPKLFTEKEMLYQLYLRVNNMALPKKDCRPPEQPRSGGKDIEQLMAYINRLAAPVPSKTRKKYDPAEAEEWQARPVAAISVVHTGVGRLERGGRSPSSQRLSPVCTTTMEPTGLYCQVVYRLPAELLEYEATDRILALAVPRHKTIRPDKIPPPPPPAPAVAGRKLKFEVSPRMANLSTARQRLKAPELDVRENPFSINPKALVAVCSPRIAKLAKPNQR